MQNAENKKQRAKAKHKKTKAKARRQIKTLILRHPAMFKGRQVCKYACVFYMPIVFIEGKKK